MTTKSEDAVRVLQELRNDVNPEGADPYGHMMADALDLAITTLQQREAGAVARPANCRNQLRADGKPYPRSGCAVCKTGGMTGCPYERVPAQAASQEAHPAADKALVTKVERTFRWDSERLQHVPQLLVEFQSVPAGEPNDAPGWTARDNLAAALDQEKGR